jgi:erythromycin esterase
MPDVGLPQYIRRLRRTIGTPGGRPADADLLRRWVADRDEAAFELLVYRHGPMVFGVCRRVLGAGPDADDAFQAAFLALVRRAAAVRDGGSVGGWLHRTALQATLRLKARRRHNQPAPPEPAAPPDDAADRADLRAVLDEEIGRLPDRFRTPFVLCYLLGRTNEEAARELGRPVGTVLSRLATARARLRVRLARRGVTASVAALAAAGSDAAAVPPELAAAAVRNATGTAPAAILALVPGEGSSMLTSHWKPLAAAVLAVGLLAAGVRLSADPAPAADDPKPADKPVDPPADPVQPPGWGVGAFSGFVGGLDRTVARSGKASGFLRKTGDGEQKFATLIQEVQSRPFRGKRVRYAGYLKTEKADPGAGLWLRVDTATASVGIDNMADRKVDGTTNWARYEIVLDVPTDATVLTFGVLLYGAGTVWVDDLTLEAVGNDVAVTREPFETPLMQETRDPAVLPAKPVNLDFEADAIAEPKAAPLTDAQKTWLKSHLVPFDTDEPGKGVADLLPLKPVIGGARVVALGEGTHGTREHFRMKHRLTEFLATQLAFTHFAIEANGPETERVNDYVLGGEGDARTVVAGMLFWTWNTQEVVDLVEWMREYNRSAKVKLQFLGFDMQFGKLAMEDTRAFVGKADPDFGKKLEEAYRDLWEYWEFDPDARKKVDALSKDEKQARAKKAWEVAEHVEKNRDRYAVKLSAAEVDRAVRTARVAAQAAQSQAEGGGYRDKCMAENVRHILDRAPEGSKIVLWAHNGHVGKHPGAMGSHLAKAYGDKMVVVGFGSGEGTYTAIKQGKGLVGDNKLLPPAAGSVEEALRSTGVPRAVLDLRTAAKEPNGRWVAEPRPFRSIGALAMDAQFFPTRVSESYDVLVYFDKTEATKCFGLARKQPKGGDRE